MDSFISQDCQPCQLYRAPGAGHHDVPRCTGTAASGRDAQGGRVLWAPKRDRETLTGVSGDRVLNMGLFLSATRDLFGVHVFSGTNSKFQKRSCLSVDLAQQVDNKNHTKPINLVSK